MADATEKAAHAGLVSRLDLRSILFLLASVGLLLLTALLAWNAYGSFAQVGAPGIVIDRRILHFVQGVFLSLGAAVTLLYGYRCLRMTDPDWRREFLRLQAPKAREFRHTAHLIRKSPLTLGGIVVIAIFAALAFTAAVAPGLVAPYPQDAGAIYYRGEEFQPPFQRTQVWRNETFSTQYSQAGWVGWNADEVRPPGGYIFPCPCPKPISGDPLNWTRGVELQGLPANVARSNLTGDAFEIGGYRLDDVYTPDIGFVGAQVRQRVSPGNHLAVSVSWDGGASWSSPRSTSGTNFSNTRWAENADFTSVTSWTPAKLQPSSFRLRAEHVTDPGSPTGPVDLDYLAVVVFFQGKYTLFGTDDLGRDYFSRIIMAAPLDLLIAIIVVASALLIGVVLGVASGYYGGWIDEAIMRITDIFLSIPGLILALAFTAALGPGLLNIMTALVITWWPGYTRLIRGQTLSIRENLYVEAARAVGVPSSRIVLRHVLPNAFAPVLVNATLDMGAVILVASALSFLGLGVQPPDPEWGAMVSDGRLYIIAQGWWWLSTFPGLSILFASLGFNLAGDGLRDILDPRLRR